MPDLPGNINSEQINPRINELLRKFPQAFKLQAVDGKQAFVTNSSAPLLDSTGVVFDLILQSDQPILIMRDKNQAFAQLDEVNLLSLIKQTAEYATSQYPVEKRLFINSTPPDQLKGTYAVPCMLDSFGRKEQAMTQVLDLNNTDQLEFIESLLIQSQKTATLNAS